MTHSIPGITAFVTGANRGIGRALVEALLAGGAKKVYAAARDLKSLSDLEKANDGRLISVKLDVTDRAAVSGAAARAADVQLLINNAGVIAHSNAPLTDAQWIEAGRREMNVNVFGTLAMIQAFAPALAKNGGGTIVNIASVASFANAPFLMTYSMSKAALHSLTMSVRTSLRPQGTRVLGVYPGPVDTDMASDIPFDKATPADVARAILDGIESGHEEIFPDPLSRQLGELFLKSPKELERQFDAMMSAM